MRSRVVLGLTAALLALPGAASAAMFSNNTPITINDGNCGGPPVQALATPYPSQIVVGGLGNVTDVNVTLVNFTHFAPADLRVLLVGPTGQTALLMHEAGSSLDVTNVTFTLDDEAANSLPAPIVAGSYKPTQTETGCVPVAAATSLPATAPAGPYGLTLAGFDGTNPNGTWSLYVVDDFVGDVGTIGGWSLDISVPAPQCSDGVDNDSNGRTDFPQDLGCSSSSDNSESSPVACPSNVNGTAGNDTFIGSDSANRFSGLGGSDFLAGQGGNDCLFGGNGSDVALGGAGNDLLDGGAGADRLVGETGADVIYGAGGGDHIDAGDGADLINPEAGSNTVLARGGDDQVVSLGGSSDTIDCGPGNDTLITDGLDSATNCETLSTP